jgi:hypothetical protein
MSDTTYVLLFCVWASAVCAGAWTILGSGALKDRFRWFPSVLLVCEWLSIAVALVVVYIIYLLSTGG